MESYIGENIKRLRRQKDITQETLAERMHVSAAAVSKWERGETLPDISMVIPLALYFGVSTDEILGLNVAENEARIRSYLEEYHRLGTVGKVYERFALMGKAYNEFPDDWRIVEEYMWQLNYDPNCTGPYGNEVHKEELYSLCYRILDECTLDRVRYSALSVLGGLYVNDGEMDKAIETAERFPDSYTTRGEELENCYERGSAEWWKQLRENIWDTMYRLQVKIRNAALRSNADDPAGQIRILKKAVSVIELIFEEGDYGFCHYDLSGLFIWIANRYVLLEDYEAAFAYYEKGFAHAKAYDELPEVSTHTSFLVRGYVQDRKNTNSSTEMNEVLHAMSCLKTYGVYEKVKDRLEMREILEKYEPFTGTKSCLIQEEVADDGLGAE